MSYLPLARKYRPAGFSDLVGQEATVHALANAIKLGREPRAVIFTGVRGVGKTTTARIYAKALNCEGLGSEVPCNQCDSCLLITEGSHEDVLEIDGASHTGVDDVRELQEFLAYRTQRSPYRIFIIDEVHMLSQSAFNALLKTLEEPPEHVVFLFATTELGKVPATILSRCLTFHLQCLTAAMIQGRLQWVLEQEGIDFEAEALQVIADQGHGSMRDALTFLDQAIVLGEGHLKLSGLRGLVSSLDQKEMFSFLQEILAKDASAILRHIAHWCQTGMDLRKGLEQCLGMLRHSFMLAALGEADQDLVDLEPGAKELCRALAQGAAPFDLHRVFRVLQQGMQELKGDGLDRYALENNLLEWCLDPGLPRLDELLEGKGETRKAKPPVSSPLKAASGVREGGASRSQWPSDWQGFVGVWRKLRPLEARMLEECHAPRFSKTEVVLEVDPNSLGGGRLLLAETQSLLKQQMGKYFGFTGQLVVRPQSQGQKPQETIRDQKLREKSEREEGIVQRAKEHPLTQDAIKILGGRVEDINILHS